MGDWLSKNYTKIVLVLALCGLAIQVFGQAKQPDSRPLTKLENQLLLENHRLKADVKELERERDEIRKEHQRLMNWAAREDAKHCPFFAQTVCRFKNTNYLWACPEGAICESPGGIPIK